MKIRPVGDALFHADGWTDRKNLTKLIVSFRNFAKEPKNQSNIAEKTSQILLKKPVKYC